MASLLPPAFKLGKDLFPSCVVGIRKRLGLTQEDLGRLLNVHGGTISRWENGKAHPNNFENELLAVFSQAAQFKRDYLGTVLRSDGVPRTLFIMLKTAFEPSWEYVPEEESNG